MARRGDKDVVDLKRMLLRLSLLDGRLLVCAEGPHLVQVASVRDPAAIVTACAKRGLLTVAELRSLAVLEHSPNKHYSFFAG